MSITKILVSAAIALGAFVAGAAPASADPHAYGAAPRSYWSDRARRIELAITWRQHLN